MSNPSLVFVAELARTGNAGHTKHYRGQSIDAGVVMDVLVGRSLRATIRGVKVQGLRFVGGAFAGDQIARGLGDGGSTGEIAVDLVGGREEEKRIATAFSSGFEYVKGSTNVYVEIVTWICDSGRNGDLRCEVVYLCRVLDDLSNFGLIANISDGDLEAAAFARSLLKEVEIIAGSGPREIVEDMNLGLCSLEQSAGPIRADETRASNDQN